MINVQRRKRPQREALVGVRAAGVMTPFVDLAGPYTRSSVLMPQKRNPYALSIVRGAAGVLIGRLSGFLAVVKTPSARTDNLIFAYGEVPRSLELAGKVTRLMSGVVRTLEVHPERMWASLESGFSQATDLAEFVMQTCGVDYRTACERMEYAVRPASRRACRSAWGWPRCPSRNPRALSLSKGSSPVGSCCLVSRKVATARAVAVSPAARKPVNAS